MGKHITCVISCPVDTFSGYGKRSLDLCKALIKAKPDWSIKILSQRWGDTRMGALEDQKEYEVMSHLTDSVETAPDIWIQITVPNEFQKVGKFNIGITAAIETTLCDPGWIEGCNRMDLVITSSNHGKHSLVDSKYTYNATGQVLEVTTPAEVLFEGLDQSKFFCKSEASKSPYLRNLKNNWNFLCVGHWMKGDFGEDRKNIAYTVKAFLETFKDWKGQVPGLILKTSQAVSSIMDRDEILKRIGMIRSTVHYQESLPNIYLLHGDLTDEEVNDVYNDPRVKALVSFTKGEGYGRPLFEFAAVGKPVIASGWSGQLDFLDPKYSILVGGKLDKVHPSAVQDHMILPDSSWFRPDDQQAVTALKAVFSNYTTWLDKAKKQARKINATMTLEDMSDTLVDILDRYLPDFPEEVELNLPEIDNLIDKS